MCIWLSFLSVSVGKEFNLCKSINGSYSYLSFVIEALATVVKVELHRALLALSIAV